MNLDELRTVQSKERRKDSLQHLRDTFYDDVADYIGGLKAERSEAAARADDPFSSPEVSRLTDEIEAAEEVAEAVYERRVGKVVKLASFAAADMPVDREGMTTQERELFEDLVTRISENKTAVLETLTGEREPASDEAASDETDPVGGGRTERDTTTPGRSETDDVLADAMGARDDSRGTDPAADEQSAEQQPSSETASDADGPLPDAVASSETPEADVPEDVPPDFRDAVEPEVTDSAGPDSDTVSDSNPDSESDPDPDLDPDGGNPGKRTDVDAEAAGDEPARTTVRITRDVGEILGVDEREYDLASEDVVTLPTRNAEPLVEREAAERLE